MKSLAYSFVSFIFILAIVDETEEQQQYPRLLFANRRDLRVVDVVGPGKKLNTSIWINNLQDATAVDWVEIDGKRVVCWSDIQAEKIECQSVGGKIETVVTSNLPAPEDLAIDWLTSKIYWTDSETNRIEIVSILKPHYRSVLIYEDVDQPRAIVVAPSAGLLFWSDWGEWPKIEKAAMDGSDRKILTDKDLIWPNGLSLDEVNSRLYWVDAKLHYISYINFDGSGRSSLKKETSPHPFALVFSSGLLFWSDWNSNSLHWMKADGSSAQRTLNLRQSLTPMDLVLFEDRPKLPNPCRNAPCSHLCLLSNNKTFTCSCPTGIKKLNQTHCNEGIEEFLLVARGTEIRQISLDTDDYTDILLGFSNLKHVLAIDYDKSSGLVVWTDDEGRKIEGGPLNNSTTKKPIVASEIVHPDGLAVDQVSSNLYWTDAGTDRIEVCRLNGSFRRIIISRGLQEPRAIAVDPNVGNLFWSDWGKKAKIERSNLDGTGRVTIVNTNILWPNGIALDFQSRTIYWCDASTDKIEMASYSGTHRRTLIQEDLPHTFGLTLVGNYIYWTDWQRRIIERAHKITGNDRRVIKDPFPDPMGLKGISNIQQPGQVTWNPCGHNNGGCLELCFWKENQVTCACRAGYELKPDNKTCVNPAAFLVFTQKSGDLHRMSLSRPFNDSNEIIPVSKVKQALAIGLDHVEGYVYWSDSKLKTISRGFINGSDSERIVEWGLLHPESLAVDYISRNIYWTDMARNRIETSKLDGSFRKILIWDVDSPKSIAVDHNESQLYFSTWLTSNLTIEKCNLDGSSRSTFTKTTGRVNSLAIDDTHIYFANIDTGNVERVHLLSREGEIVHRSVSNSFSLVAVYENYVYISDFTSNSILKASKKPNSQDAIIIATSVDIFDMSIYNKQIQSSNKPDFCKSNPCTHLCFNSESGPICSCPTHYKYVNNNCIPPKEFLLLANNNSITRLIFDDDNECPDSVLLGGLKKLRGLAWNSNTGSGGDLIYCDAKGIKGGGAEGVGNLVGGGEFKSIAYDSVRGLLFYSREGVLALNVSDGRGQWSGGIWPHSGSGLTPQVQTSSSADFSKFPPLHITLSILTAQIYFALSNVIYRVRYDGLQALKFESDYAIQGLVVDEIDRFIFWTDSSGRLYRANLDFSNPIVLVVDVAGIGQVTVHWRHVYWLDSFRSLERVDKFTGYERARLLALDEAVVDLISVNDTFFSALKPSYYCNNECSHICLENNICACPVDLTLSKDGRTCGYKLACGASEFECRAGSISCISSMNKCNGIDDCHDGSDESDCCENYCSCSSDNRQKCPCWTKKQLCDGVKNCPEGEDELNCGYKSGSEGHASDSTNTLTLLAPLLVLILIIMAASLFCVKRKRKQKRREQLLRRSTTTAETLFHTTSASGAARNPTPPSSASSPYCELLVPNPSPATETRSCCNDLYYKQAPPPTPCSTDVCDESEIYAPPPSLHTSPSTVRSNKYLPPPPSPDLN